MEKENSSVLVYRLSALGDVAMTVPAVYSVARAYPTVSFTMVTSELAAGVYVGAPKNVSVVGLQKADCRGLLGTLRLLRLLWAIDADAMADLHNVLRSWMVDAMYRLRGRRVEMLRKSRCERRALLRHRNKVARLFTQRYFDVFERLGMPASANFKTLFPDSLPPLPAAFPQKGEAKWVGVAPFARYATKTYPPHLMLRVVQALAVEPGVRVFLFGARGTEADVLKQWEQTTTGVISVAGTQTLAAELALMARLDVMVSMDSANMHLASLSGTRVVSIWGATSPACGFMGYGQRPADAIALSILCSPCSIAGKKQCTRGKALCLSALQPQTIVRRVTEILNL
ncbi:MAG: glycosyltransferase family 9 protein [Bacteroidaceae bacterium]|nr:glycosyltransferase family 9 protein [Bacteroidaceae bacterium]